MESVLHRTAPTVNANGPVGCDRRRGKQERERLLSLRDSGLRAESVGQDARRAVGSAVASAMARSCVCVERRLGSSRLAMASVMRLRDLAHLVSAEAARRDRWRAQADAARAHRRLGIEGDGVLVGGDVDRLPARPRRRARSRPAGAHPPASGGCRCRRRRGAAPAPAALRRAPARCRRRAAGRRGTPAAAPP